MSIGLLKDKDFPPKEGPNVNRMCLSSLFVQAEKLLTKEVEEEPAQESPELMEGVGRHLKGLEGSGPTCPGEKLGLQGNEPFCIIKYNRCGRWAELARNAAARGHIPDDCEGGHWLTEKASKDINSILVSLPHSFQKQN